MKRVDSDALIEVNRTLDLAGGGVVAPTDLNDELLFQILNVNPLVRRARTEAGTNGIYSGLMQNTHVAAGTLTASINPYAPTVTNARTTWPATVPQHFDVWVLGATVSRVGGAGDIDGAVLSAVLAAEQQGWGVLDTGGGLSGTATVLLARWVSTLDVSVATGAHAVLGDGSYYARINQRLHRGTTIDFASDAAAAANFRCALLLGLFPASLGQDVAL